MITNKCKLGRLVTFLGLLIYFSFFNYSKTVSITLHTMKWQAQMFMLNTVFILILKKYLISYQSKTYVYNFFIKTQENTTNVVGVINVYEASELTALVSKMACI